MNQLFILLQYCLPHHLLSRIVGRVAASKRKLIKNIFIRWFVRRYKVDLSLAKISDPKEFDSFNDFFTRELKEGARPIASEANAVVSPADGVISAIGEIETDSLIQAKGKNYTVASLLGGDEKLANEFHYGNFATVYLSPKDYHRVHMPLSGTLREMIYVPGKLFSVNQTTAENIPDLFARNERAVCIFDTECGPMAVVLVGAMIVAGIETVWARQVAPTKLGMYRTSYEDEPPIHLQKGDELGRFKLGSTAIVLFGAASVNWQTDFASMSSVQMGELIGTLQAS